MSMNFVYWKYNMCFYEKKILNIIFIYLFIYFFIFLILKIRINGIKTDIHIEIDISICFDEKAISMINKRSINSLFLF